MNMEVDFDSSLFLVEVREGIRAELSRAISRLEEDLMNISKTKNKGVDQAALKQCCQKFKKMLAKNFSQNIKKFEMYSEENIFTSRNSAPVAATKGGNGISKTDRETLDQLRAEFTAEQETYEVLSRETQHLAGLLHEMQSSLFDLRVSGQALDSLSLQPLDEAVARISQQVQHLNRLCTNADAISTALRDESMDPSTIDFSADDLIVTGNVEDINLLAGQFEH